MEQELDVPLLTGDGRTCGPSRRQSYRSAFGANLVQHAGANVLVADDAAPDFGTTRLELWLDECNDVAARPQHWRDDREDQTQGDERHVDTDDIDGTRQIRQRQMASVEVLDHDHARIVSKRPVKLPMPD